MHNEEVDIQWRKQTRIQDAYLTSENYAQMN